MNSIFAKYHLNKVLIIFGIIAIILALLGGGGYLYLYTRADNGLKNAISLFEQSKKDGLTTTDSINQEITSNQAKIKPFASYTDLNAVYAFSQIIPTELKNQLIQDQKTLLAQKLKQFENSVIASETIKIPSRANMVVDYNEYKSLFAGLNTFGDIQNLSQRIVQSQAKIDDELNSSKVALIFSSLESSLKEADTLVTFFQAQPGFDSEKQALADYKKSVQDLLLSRGNTNYNATDLDTKLNKEVYPLIQKARQTKIDNDQNEKQRLISLANLESQRRRNLNLIEAPQAPISGPKVIYVNIQNQQIYVYEQGYMIFSSNVVTGMPGFDTVTGQYSIYAKAQNVVLTPPQTEEFKDIQYSVPAKYWMPFYLGYGIHDAPWRGDNFGLNIYKTAGSHGCVNSPDKTADFIYNWANVGTPVVVN